MNNQELVYKIVSKIPKGKVTTYGIIAKTIGIKNPRVVGNILHQNKNPEVVPCHRVVNRLGKAADNYAFGGKEAQRKRLEDEGIIFENDKIDLDKFLWIPPSD
ncbi:MAG: MGMT family protein [Patescibacteria group bacterium]|nr:MGMT family protein [Patescibacteria group bacterium]